MSPNRGLTDSIGRRTDAHELTAPSNRFGPSGRRTTSQGNSCPTPSAIHVPVGPVCACIGAHANNITASIWKRCFISNSAPSAANSSSVARLFPITSQDRARSIRFSKFRLRSRRHGERISFQSLQHRDGISRTTDTLEASSLVKTLCRIIRRDA